jgi:hypothetical protein
MGGTATTPTPHRRRAAERPDDYDLVMWFDFSPMRLDEYLRQDAMLFNEIVLCKNAAEDGRSRAASEKQAMDAANAMSDG